MSKNPAFLESKRHYEILDGLRGVASILVVVFHVFEAFSGGSRFRQIINHGYLAVDFFFPGRPGIPAYCRHPGMGDAAGDGGWLHAHPAANIDGHPRLAGNAPA